MQTFLYLRVNYPCVPGVGCAESSSCFQWPHSPLRRPKFQARTTIKLMNACQALIQYAITLLSPLLFCRGKEAGVFNKVIALLLYFPFINYKELGAECGRHLAQREGYRTGWECKLVRALSESKLAMPSKVAASWLPFPAQFPRGQKTLQCCQRRPRTGGK